MHFLSIVVLNLLQFSFLSYSSSSRHKVFIIILYLLPSSAILGTFTYSIACLLSPCTFLFLLFPFLVLLFFHLSFRSFSLKFSFSHGVDFLFQSINLASCNTICNSSRCSSLSSSLFSLSSIFFPFFASYVLSLSLVPRKNHLFHRYLLMLPFLQTALCSRSKWGKMALFEVHDNSKYIRLKC